MFTTCIKSPVLRGAAEWFVFLALAALLFFVMRGLFRTAHVDGNSMSPTLDHGDIVFLNRLVYLLSSPQAGDIVAFPNPEDPSEFFIKRVIAVPGDTVDLRGGIFFVNNEPLDDAFSEEPTRAKGDVGFPIVVEEAHCFVLGDNRNGSQDSRFASVGTIPANNMVGRASIRFWPLSRAGRVS